MIAYIRGKIAHKSRTDVILEANGIGYHIHITLNTYNDIVNVKDELKLLTYFAVKEDSQTLYGFAQVEERVMFEQLISVSGVGANTARVLLSTFTAEEMRKAIISENVNAIKSAKGIGPKSAKRIILELKDKLLKDSGGASEAIAATLMGDNAVREEALSALVALGFNRAQVQKVLNKILKQNSAINDSGELIKMALSQLSS